MLAYDVHTSAANFEDKMRALSKAGYRAITTRQVLDWYRIRKPLPPKTVTCWMWFMAAGYSRSGCLRKSRGAARFSSRRGGLAGRAGTCSTGVEVGSDERLCEHDQGVGGQGALTGGSFGS